MLLLRRKLPNRVPNLLAALGAVLLVVSSMVGKSESISAAKPPSSSYAKANMQAMDAPRDDLPVPQKSRRKGLKISLMFFH